MADSWGLFGSKFRQYTNTLQIGHVMYVYKTLYYAMFTRADGVASYFLDNQKSY